MLRIADRPTGKRRPFECSSSTERPKAGRSRPSPAGIKEGGKATFLRITLPWIAVIGLLSSAGPVRADYDLAVKKNCLACHCVNKRKYGPSFQQVAAKYADQKNAAEVLAKKIRRGGTGVWGIDMMPPQPQVAATGARAMGIVRPSGRR